jgi:site-specific DNA recombinase
MNLAEPLRPKDPEAGLRVIVPARISTPGQDPESNASQHEDTERFLARVYAGPVEVRRLADQASGWLVGRAVMDVMMELIRSGTWDAVVVGEVREIYRNPELQWAVVHHCLDHDTRFISVFDGVDTADENWEVMMHTACLRHGMAVPEVRRRVRRKATHSFKNGGMVLKVRFGYRKLTKGEADGGEFGPKGLRIARVATCTVYIQGMRTRVLAGVSYPVVAEWLNDEGVTPGPYVTGGKWTGRLVRELLMDPILSGQRQFRKEVSRLVYSKGKNKPRANPAAPEMQDCPDLAHFTPVEHRELLAVMKAREAVAAAPQKGGRDSPLYNVPRARSLWPGQHARCGVCGGLMYRYGELLKCQNALGKGPRECWNHVLVRIAEVHARVLPLVLRFLDTYPPARSVVATLAWAECQRVRGRQNRGLAGLDDRIADLEKQAGFLAKAIGKGGNMDALLSELGAVNQDLSAARTQRTRLATAGETTGAYGSAAEIAAGLGDALPWLAATSRDFADILRRLISTFEVVPVQGLDRPAVRPRARLTISAAAGARPGEAGPPEVAAVIDLFDPPAHIRHEPACRAARAADPTDGLQAIGERLGVTKMTVKRALDYGRLMDQAEVRDPYQELRDRPAAASRWRYRDPKGSDGD